MLFLEPFYTFTPSKGRKGTTLCHGHLEPFLHSKPLKELHLPYTSVLPLVRRFDVESAARELRQACGKWDLRQPTFLFRNHSRYLQAYDSGMIRGGETQTKNALIACTIGIISIIGIQHHSAEFVK